MKEQLTFKIVIDFSHTLLGVVFAEGFVFLRGYLSFLLIGKCQKQYECMCISLLLHWTKYSSHIILIPFSSFELSFGCNEVGS